MPINDDAAKLAFRKAERAFKNNALHALRGHEGVGQHHAGVTQLRVHLHVLVAAQAVQMRKRFTNGKHGEW